MCFIMMKMKLYWVVVIQVDLYYEGLIFIDKDLFEVVGIFNNEQVDVFNIINGECFIIYVIEVLCGSWIFGINGVVVCFVQLGDCIIVVVYVEMEVAEVEVWILIVVLLDEYN